MRPCPCYAYALSVLARLRRLDMVDFTTERPPVVNGLFAVPKGDKQRLIVDCRPVNDLLVPSPHVDLPTPDLVASFAVPDGETLVAAKCDLDNFYHRLKMPRAWWRYFALPAVSARDVGGLPGVPPDAQVWPCITTVPMGFSHAVFLAQSAHEHLVDTRVPLLRRADRIRPAPRGPGGERWYGAPDLALNRMRHSIYIDDLNIYSTDATLARAALAQYRAVMAAAGLPEKPEKVLGPTSDGLECLGVLVHGARGEVGLAVPKLERLRATTLHLLDRGSCTGRELSRIIGRWTWAMLVARPALAVFGAVYRFIAVAGERRFQLWPSVRRELYAAAMLAPLLFRSIRTSLAHVAVATDASSTGLGVVRSVVPRALAEAAAAAPSVPGKSPAPAVSVALKAAPWATVVSHRWRDEEHINVLEVRAVLTGVRWALSQPRVAACGRLLLFTDSSAAAGAMRKGRTSSRRLAHPLRALHALLLASGLSLRTVWIPSATNPADAASRQ